MSSLAKRDTKTFVTAAILVKIRDKRRDRVQLAAFRKLKVTELPDYTSKPQVYSRLRYHGHGLVRLRQLRGTANGGS